MGGNDLVDGCQLAASPELRAKEVKDINQSNQTQRDESQSSKGPSGAHVLEHGNTSMTHGCRNQERRDQESGNSRSSNIAICVAEVVEHSQPQQRIAETEDTACNDGGPVGSLSVGGEGKPEEGDGEQPDCDQRGEEAGFGAVLAVLDAVLAEEVGLDGNEDEHDSHTDAEVEVRQTGADVAETIVVDKDVEDTIEVQEQEAIKLLVDCCLTSRVTNP